MTLRTNSLALLEFWELQSDHSISNLMMMSHGSFKGFVDQADYFRKEKMDTTIHHFCWIQFNIA